MGYLWSLVVRDIREVMRTLRRVHGMDPHSACQRPRAPPGVHEDRIEGILRRLRLIVGFGEEVWQPKTNPRWLVLSETKRNTISLKPYVETSKDLK